MRRHPLGWAAWIGMVCAVALPSLASAQVVEVTGERLGRKALRVFGPSADDVVAGEQAIALQAPAGRRLNGVVIALFNPRPRTFWWAYQSTEGSDAPKDGWLSPWLMSGAIYADEERIVRFSGVSRRGLWMRESQDIVDSFRVGMGQVLGHIEQMAPEWFGAGGWYLLHQDVLLAPHLKPADQEFFQLPLHAEALPDATITDVQRTLSEWTLQLHGNNPDHPAARLSLGHDGQVHAFVAQ